MCPAWAVLLSGGPAGACACTTVACVLCACLVCTERARGIARGSVGLAACEQPHVASTPPARGTGLMQIFPGGCNP
eukprot:4435361-Alexandrium_andersonii.AAC.1